MSPYVWMWLPDGKCKKCKQYLSFLLIANLILFFFTLECLGTIYNLGHLQIGFHETAREAIEWYFECCCDA